MIEVYGHSDDVVGVGDEELNCYDRTVVLEFGNLEEGGCRVVLRYGLNGFGVWQIAVEQLAEGVGIPFTVSMRTDLKEHPYSVILELGDGAVLNSAKALKAGPYEAREWDVVDGKIQRN